MNEFFFFVAKGRLAKKKSKKKIWDEWTGLKAEFEYELFALGWLLLNHTSVSLDMDE